MTETEFHNTTSRYYPVTKKDHEIKPSTDHKYCECENEGMCTHTTSSRYVPAGGTTGIFKLLKHKGKNEDTNLKTNWFGMQW